MQNTSLSEWLGTLTGFSATSLNRLWRILMMLFLAYCAILGLGNILSGTGYNHVNWFLLFVWELLAIGILVSPYVWGGIVGVATGREVTAGQAGFQFGHVYAASGELGKKFASFWFQYIMLWPAIGFIYLAANDTTGYIALHFVLLALLPLTIPYSVYRWPGSKGVVHFFGMLILLGTLLLVGYLVWQSINRQIMNPAERTVLEASEALEKKRQEEMNKVARDIKKKLFMGQELTPEEQTAWSTIQQSMSEQSIIGRLKGAASIHKNEADKAMAADEARARNARIKKAADCFAKLTPESTDEARGTCKHLHWMIDQGRSSGGSAQAKIPPLMPTVEGHEEPSTPPQAPKLPPAQRVADSMKVVSCDGETWKEFTYVPSAQRGRMELGTLPPGQYEIRVAGQVWQDFHNGAAFSHRYQADPDGRLGQCVRHDGQPCPDLKNQVWHAPAAKPGMASIAVPGEPYGKILVHAWGQPLPIGSQGQIHTKDALPIAIDSNVYRYPGSYAGAGEWRVTIKQCV